MTRIKENVVINQGRIVLLLILISSINKLYLFFTYFYLFQSLFIVFRIKCHTNLVYLYLKFSFVCTFVNSTVFVFFNFLKKDYLFIYF